MKKNQKCKSKARLLYHHRTDGGAEYLMDKFILCRSGHKEGVCEGANLIVRLDGQPEIIRDDERDTLLKCREMLQTLIQLHEGLDDGGNGIEAKDWMKVSETLDAARKSA